MIRVSKLVCGAGCAVWLAVAVLAGGCSKPAEQTPPKPAAEKPASVAATQEPSGTSTFKLPPVTKSEPVASTPKPPAPQTPAQQAPATKPDTAGKQESSGKPAAAPQPPAAKPPAVEPKPAAPAKPAPASKPDAAAKPEPKPAATPKPAAGGQSPLLGAWVTVGPGSQRRLEIKENGSGAVMLGDIPWIRFTWVKDGNDIVATHVDNDVKFRITARGDGRLSWRAADGGSAKEVEYERER